VTGRSGTIGKVHYIEDDYWPHNTSLWVTSFKGNFPKFIYFLYMYIGLDRFGTGSGVPTLNRNDVHSYQVAMPSRIAEQTAIASVLSDTDALIENLENLVAKKRAIKQGTMQQLLTGKKRLPGFEKQRGYKKTEIGMIPEDWEVKRVGEIFHFQGGSQPSKENFVFQEKDGYVRLLQIRDYKNDNYETYIPKIPKDLAKRFCNKDDIMIGRYGPPIFQILNGLSGAYNVALIKAIPNTLISNRYGWFILKQEKLFRFVENLSQRSSGQTGVDLIELKKYPIPLPPLVEQTAIASVLSDMDAEIEILEQKCYKYQQIKQGMMQQLLTGKIRLLDC
jgi:type I restriction enzyme S subunit